MDILELEVAQNLCPDELTVRNTDISYGTVRSITYFSKTTGLERRANVLLPGNFDENKTYPLLFFLHGIFCDENTIICDENNKINEISSNLVAQGLARECIIVFPNIYATNDPEQKPAFDQAAVAPYNNFINDLKNDLIPYIEKNFPVSLNRNDRGIIGFSMGGRETIFIGINMTDTFSAIGAIAPAPGLVPAKDWAMEHPGQLTEAELTFNAPAYQPSLFMICCGSKDSVVGTYPKSYHDIFTKNQVPHIWYEVPDADHDSNAIRSGFYNFLIRW